MKNISYAFSIVLFLLFFAGSNAQGQIEVLGTEDMLDRLRLKELSGKSSDIEAYVDIAGDAFIDREFRSGIVKMKEGEQYKGEFRYDMYAEQIEFKRNNLIYTLVNPDLIDYVIISDTKLIHAQYVTKIQGVKNTYFTVLTDGNAMLLKRNQVLFKEGEPAKLYQDAKPASFVKASDPYYIKIGDEPAMNVTRKRSLTEILGDEGGKISSFIKKEKISPNDPEDIKALVSFYNSLK